jgi:hypothetical protein
MDILPVACMGALNLNHPDPLQVRELQKKLQHIENDLDMTLEKLTVTTTK